MRRYPAEWEVQDAIVLSWPHNPLTWGPHKEAIQDFYLRLAAVITRFQPLLLLVPDALLDQVRHIVSPGRFPVSFHAMPTNDIWVRDYGPFLLDDGGAPLSVQYRFNAWGGKFPPWSDDDRVPETLARDMDWRLESHPWILEGGAMEFDGGGAAMTTRDCLIGTGRNSENDFDAILHSIRSAFGLSELLVIPGGLAGDHTDGHIDNLARFLAPGHVLLPSTDAAGEENRMRICQAEELLCQWRPAGKGLELHRLPLPPQRKLGDEVLPASYCNFIFLNGAVVIPLYGCPADKDAMAFFQEFYPDREVVGMDCQLVIQEGGSLHCMSKQLSRIKG